MARCTRDACGRWRPNLLVRVARLGLEVDGDWFCSNACVEAAAARRLRDVRPSGAAPRQRPQSLGAVLIRQHDITPAQLVDALAAQRETGLRLGAQLQRLGYANREVVLRALSAQHGVSYLTTIDPAAVRLAPGRLSADEVRALGVVPLRETDDELLVACPAPLPHAALGALGALSGRTIEPFLVTDDDFERLKAAYGGATDAPVHATTVRDVEDGASRIAEAAAQAGAVSVRETRVDPFTWVRISANGRVSTLLVPPDPAQLEEHERWLAATTRH